MELSGGDGWRRLRIRPVRRIDESRVEARVLLLKQAWASPGTERLHIKSRLAFRLDLDLDACRSASVGLASLVQGVTNRLSASLGGSHDRFDLGLHPAERDGAFVVHVRVEVGDMRAQAQIPTDIGGLDRLEHDLAALWQRCDLL